MKKKIYSNNHECDSLEFTLKFTRAMLETYSGELVLDVYKGLRLANNRRTRVNAIAFYLPQPYNVTASCTVERRRNNPHVEILLAGDEKEVSGLEKDILSELGLM